MTDDPGAGNAVHGVVQRVLDLVGALRRAGIGATQAEAIDAVRALPSVDLLERAQLREALAAVTITSAQHRPVFDELFDLYFPARPGGKPGSTDRCGHDPDDEQDIQEYLHELTETLEAGDGERLRELARMAVEEFGRVEGRDGGVSYFQYRVFRRVDLQQLLRDLLTRAQDRSDNGLTALQERLHRDEFEARLRMFAQEIETDVRRRATRQRGLESVADRMARPPIEEVDLFHLHAQDQARIRAQIAPLARKLATRVAVKRRHGRQGRLDVRRTVRRSLMTGGVPFEPAFRSRRAHRPELFVLCDVSGSVASFARFTLLLVHALQEQFSRVRSFAFIDTLDEITGMFAAPDADEAITRTLSGAELVSRDGHSDYGRALERFHAEYAADVTARSTVLLLGDARNNHRQANAWVLDELSRRARRVYWLNPEPIQFWDTGDSIASNYARHTDDMVEVRNLRQLTAFVERLV